MLSPPSSSTKASALLVSSTLWFWFCSWTRGARQEHKRHSSGESGHCMVWKRGRGKAHGSEIEESDAPLRNNTRQCAHVPVAGTKNKPLVPPLPAPRAHSLGALPCRFPRPWCCFVLRPVGRQERDTGDKKIQRKNDGYHGSETAWKTDHTTLRAAQHTTDDCQAYLFHGGGFPRFRGFSLCLAPAVVFGGRENFTTENQ